MSSHAVLDFPVSLRKSCVFVLAVYGALLEIFQVSRSAANLCSSRLCLPGIDFFQDAQHAAMKEVVNGCPEAHLRIMLFLVE